MKAAVLDASVAAKWVLPEPHADRALALLRTVQTLHAPAHWMAEAANALWARVVIRRELGADEIRPRIAFLVGAPVQVTALSDILTEATALALELRSTVYDALYVALAEKLDLPLITADRKLCERAAAMPRFAERVVWIGDLPAA